MSLEKIDSMEVRPLMNDKPLPNAELVGDALSIISLKNLEDSVDPEHVVKRNSFRDLHRPNISLLNWVVNSDGKDEVLRRCRLMRKIFLKIPLNVKINVNFYGKTLKTFINVK